MRVAFEGNDGYLSPLVLQLTNGVPFPTATYIESGYTDIEILCIGASGGRGGFNNRSESDPSNASIAGGGGGGGGGLHRISTLLSALPSEVDVVVGVVGDPGTSNEDETLVTDGEDGGYSSFNGVLTCCASGGKGGLGGHGDDANPYLDTGAAGGDGGIGGVIVAGGGAAGASEFGEAGADGTWDGTIGEGGGGGYGGIVFYTDVVVETPGAGGKGSYKVDDTLFYGPAGLPWVYPPLLTEVSEPMMGGRGGGAKATKLNNLLQAYGQSGPGHISDGLVLVRLTQVV